MFANVGPQQRIPRVVPSLPVSGPAADFIYDTATDAAYIANNAGAYQILDTGSGDIGGSTGIVDNAIIRADGVGGKTVQSSAVIIADTTGIITGTQGVTISGSTSGSVAIAATATGGQLAVGTGPTTVTDAAGKILSAALNTVGSAQGGTGVANNAASTLAISGNFATTLTITGITTVTLPTTGTLLTTTGSGAGLSGVTLSAVVPNTAPSAGQILAGNAGGTAYAPVSMSSDATLASTGALTLASTISAGGPTGSATVAPIITYDAKGRLTTVTSATITPAVGSITGLGTGVATALGVNVGSAGAFVVFNGALGTPSSGTLTSATGLPISTGLTGAGTGVLTALGVNVGSAGAFITFNGAGGTPSSLTGTNISGTAASLTAGNATTLATARTIGGVSFNGSANITVASATGGFAVTGGGLTVTNDNAVITFVAANGTNGTYITGSNTSGSVYLAVEGSAGSTFPSSTANAAILASGGAKPIEFYVNAVKNVIFASGGGVNMPNLATSSAATTGTVCWTTGTGLLNVDTTTSCLLSSSKFKKYGKPLVGGLDTVMKLQPISYFLKNTFNPSRLGEQIGLMAEDVAKVDRRLVSTETDGSPHAVRYMQLTAVLASAIQEQHSIMEALTARLNTLWSMMSQNGIPSKAS